MTSFKQDYFPPPRRPAAVGMWLFLAALAMLFIAAMLLYVLLREHVYGNAPTGPIHLPIALWFSTLALLGASFTIHRALVNVRMQRIAAFGAYLQVTLLLALIFLGVQFPCMWAILAEHRHNALVGGHRLYGLVFCLILLHAAHVIGGVVALAIVAARAIHGKYDHEDYLGVQNVALYWHFLDAVWLIMFAVFLATG